MRMNETCYVTGADVTVEGVRLSGDDQAVIRLALGGMKDSRTMLYEDGLWRLEPTAEFAKQIDQGMSADEAIEDLKAKGKCMAASQSS